MIRTRAANCVTRNAVRCSVCANCAEPSRGLGQPSAERRGATPGSLVCRAATPSSLEAALFPRGKLEAAWSAGAEPCARLHRAS